MMRKPELGARVYEVMPYSRQRPRVARTGRIAVRVNTGQRDLLAHAVETPKEVVYALRRAPVRSGKLSVRVTRDELAAFITIVAGTVAPDRRAVRALATFLRYLEALEDRFDEPDELGQDEPSPESSG